MPIETRTPRDGSAVGRFPSVTLGFGEDTGEEKKQPNVKNDGAPLHWWQKMCPCCSPKSKDDHTLVTGIDDLNKEGVSKKPAIVGSEIQGNFVAEPK